MKRETTTSRTGGAAGGRVSIRPARSGDAPQLARLAGELGYPTEADEMRLRLQKIASRTDHAVFVAERGAPAPGQPSPSNGGAGEDILGWVHVAREMLLESGETAEILGLVVDGSSRRGGVGRRLVTAAEDWGRALSLRQIVVRSNVTREEAHRFYPALGYLLAKTQRKYAKELRDPSTA